MILTSKEIIKLEEDSEQYTTLYKLMKVAGKKVYEFVKKQYNLQGKTVLILCGKGNNGGDGFICANHLVEDGIAVKVLLAQGTPMTDLGRKAYKKLNPKVDVLCTYDKELFDADLIIDGIFGFNFRGVLEGTLKEIVELANQSHGKRVAIDIPSGAVCDTGQVDGVCFQADATVTFTSYKPVHLVTPGASYCGETIHVAQVGIKQKELESVRSLYKQLEHDHMQSLIKKRVSDSHKGSYGRLLMICGSYGMLGAAMLVGKAALRSGVGMLEVITTKEAYPILAPVLPEAIFEIIEIEKDKELILEKAHLATGCVIGSGLGKDANWYMKEIIPNIICPTVIDADGLNYLSTHKDFLPKLKQEVIITPHPKEMSRLVGTSVQEVQNNRIQVCSEFSVAHNVVTVLKGKGTVISSKTGQISINTTGNPGMAKAGSGDVLAGIIGSLVAQNIGVKESAELGVYLHGFAGDEKMVEMGMVSMLPSDYINSISKFLM